MNSTDPDAQDVAPGPSKEDLPLAELVLVNEGVRYKIRKKVTTLGRISDCDVVLSEDDRISRVHAEIRRSPRGCILQDKSHNGTWVNGQKIKRVLLQDGDEIRLGNKSLTYYTRGSSAETRKKEGKKRRVGTNREILKVLYHEVAGNSP